MAKHRAQEQLEKIWALLSSDVNASENIRFVGAQEQLLPSVFDLTGFAMASIGAANLAAARVRSARLSESETPLVELDTFEAVAAFKSESLLKPKGWNLAPPWDPIAGDYPAKDGWIRLHTNYPYHRQAVLRALGLNEADRQRVTERLANLRKLDVEERVLSEGGCAAVQYSREEWAKTALGESTLHEQPISLTRSPASLLQLEKIDRNDRPLRGVRVLDLTRVIAGPECTRFLSSHGADVLRLDPPGFEEVAALLPETTVGKRCAFLDLRSQEGQARFQQLISEAHVLVSGLRADALERLGFSFDALRRINPRLIVAQVNAYGWSSKGKARRGYDSLVQMSSGIAELGARESGSSKPTPMPVQALDHGAGFLLAAGVCEAITELLRTGQASVIRSSLVGLSNFLFDGPRGQISEAPVPNDAFRSCLIEDQSEWGLLERVGVPGRIDGKRAHWSLPAGALGRSEARF